MKISVARALTELKTINNRIEKKIDETIFIAGVKKTSKKIKNVYTRDEFIELAKSNYQSIKDLIKRRKDIKSSIVESNANTIVEIAGVKMSVADAIERKNSIELDKMLLAEMTRDYNSIVSQVQAQNEDVEMRLDSLLNSSIGSDKKDLSGMEGFAKAYRESNEYEIINPLNLEDEIKKLSKQIEDFESEVDAVLTESNVMTKIEIPD